MLGIFKNIFSKKQDVNISSLQGIAVDMHSHLVPGIDDGSKSSEESRQIISFMKDLGYQKIITTPHIMKGGYDNTTEIIQSGTQKLQVHLQEQHIEIDLECTSEYYLDSHFQYLIEQKDLMPFGRSKYILFELSYLNRPSSFEETVFNLSIEGYMPILAHPERYKFFYGKDLNEYTKIKDKGILLQLNLFSLVGAYGSDAQKVAEQLIEKKMIDFVGTDIHNAVQLQYFEPLLKNKYLDMLLQQDSLKNKKLLTS